MEDNFTKPTISDKELEIDYKSIIYIWGLHEAINNSLMKAYVTIFTLQPLWFLVCSISCFLSLLQLLNTLNIMGLKTDQVCATQHQCNTELTLCSTNGMLHNNKNWTVQRNSATNETRLSCSLCFGSCEQGHDQTNTSTVWPVIMYIITVIWSADPVFGCSGKSHHFLTLYIRVWNCQIFVVIQLEMHR